MQASIVFCHHKGSFIDGALRSALRSTGITFEIIVMTSDRRIIVRPPVKHTKVTYIHCEGGPARKRNEALKYTKYPFIAYYDDDTELDGKSVYRLAQSLKKKDVGMVFGKLLKMDDHGKFDEAGGFMTWTGFIWARGDRKRDVGQYDEECEIFAGKSAACMIRRDVMEQAGAFDESFEILGEESDLAWRVWRTGHKVLYVPKSVTYHAFDTKLKPKEKFYTVNRVYYNGCRNYFSMLIKNAPGSLLRTAIPFQVFAWTFAAFGHLFRGNWRACLSIFRGCAYCLLKIQSLIKYRKSLPIEVVVPTFNPPLFYYIKRFFNYIRTGLHG